VTQDTSRPRLVFMFSGQGSQYFQMARDLYDGYEVFRETMHVGERIVRRKLGRSLLAELYGRSHTQVFDDLRLSHPALLMTEYAIYRVLISEGIAPDAVWGSSLGEFVAAVASGAWSYETAMDAVLEHARLVTAHCEPGGMLAVLGGLEHYDALVAEGIPLTLAGVNFAMHFTLAGTPA
jgi:acyl transferase domain-containing protein